MFAGGRLRTNGQRRAVSWKAKAKSLSKRKLGSRKGAPIQPALSRRSACGPHVPGREGILFSHGVMWLFFGEKWVEARTGGGFPSSGPALVEGSPGPVSVLHRASQQQAPIAPPWVLLQSTYAWCQGRLLPAPFWSPTLGHLPIPSFKRHFWGCRRVLR